MAPTVEEISTDVLKRLEDELFRVMQVPPERLTSTPPRPLPRKKLPLSPYRCMMGKFVAIESDRIVEVHAEGIAGYATLCGLDGNDPVAGQKPAALPARPYVTCGTCREIIRIARGYTSKDM